MESFVIRVGNVALEAVLCAFALGGVMLLIGKIQANIKSHRSKDEQMKKPVYISGAR